MHLCVPFAAKPLETRLRRGRDKETEGDDKMERGGRKRTRVGGGEEIERGRQDGGKTQWEASFCQIFCFERRRECEVIQSHVSE